MHDDNTVTIPNSHVLVKIRHDFETNKSLLIKFAATTLLSHIPHLATGLQQNPPNVTSVDGLHPTQLSQRKRSAVYHTIDSTDVLLKSEFRFTTRQPRLFTISEARNEEK